MRMFKRLGVNFRDNVRLLKKNKNYSDSFTHLDEILKMNASQNIKKKIDYKNVKVKIEEDEGNKFNSESALLKESDVLTKIKESKWSQEYTFPDVIQKYKLKEGAKTNWRKLPDQQVIPWYYRYLLETCLFFFVFAWVMNWDQVLKSLNNQYIYDHKAKLK